MSLKVKHLMRFMEELAPIDLKESYDNVGLMIGDKEQDVRSVLIALDCTLEAIEEAKDKGANMIITHHPLLFRKPSSITTESLQGRKIIELIRNNINLYSSHTNLDSVKDGMNDTIVSLLGFEDSKVSILEPTSSPNYEKSGIGRIIELNESISAQELSRLLKDKLSIDFLRMAGNESKEIRKIAIINGSGQDFFEISRRMGADCIITGDTTYHFVSDYAEMGLVIFDIGHFSSEWPLFKAIAQKIKDFVQTKDSQVKFYISENSKEPYKYI